MGYKLLALSARRNNISYIRGTVGGARFEEMTGKATREAADLWAAQYIAGPARSSPATGPALTFPAVAKHLAASSARPTAAATPWRPI